MNNTQRQGRKALSGRGAGIAIAALFLVGLAVAGTLLWAGGRLTATQVRAQHTLQLAPQPQPKGNGYSTVDIVDIVSPSVVSVELYRGFSLNPLGTGSGIVLSADGYVLTNAHVVEQIDTDGGIIHVVTNSEESYTARIIGLDYSVDIAVLKVNADGLVPAEFANSDDVRVGQVAIAVGNAAGILPGSPTQGIISGVDRQLPRSIADGSIVEQMLLQTDAAINPGNSGGALVNEHGQVIGVNVAKLQSTEIDNIGFAIPSNDALEAAQSILDKEEAKR